MPYFDYADVRAFLHDQDFIELLCADLSFTDLLDRFLVDDFLALTPGAKVPFFAEVRDYVGAAEHTDPKRLWIVKEIADDAVLPAAMGSICFFLDFFARTISAPTVVTRIEGKLYKAAKVVTKAEQLSGANYTDIPQLKEQLLLDLINRWIYCDEDRNPNNYMIRYTSRGDQVVIAIDFANVDLLFPGTKIKGIPESFGWERMEKTRYLTPLKREHFEGYDMQLFGMRFDAFARVGRRMLMDLCKRCLRLQPDATAQAKLITENVLKRIEYVRDYFSRMFPKVARGRGAEKYKDMGSTFTQIFKER